MQTPINLNAKNYTAYLVDAIARQNGFIVGMIKEVREFANCYLVLFHRGSGRFVSKKNYLTRCEYTMIRENIKSHPDWEIKGDSFGVIIKLRNLVNVSVYYDPIAKVASSNFGIDFQNEYGYTTRNLMELIDTAKKVLSIRDRKMEDLMAIR